MGRDGKVAEKARLASVKSRTYSGLGWRECFKETRPAYLAQVDVRLQTSDGGCLAKHPVTY